MPPTSPARRGEPALRYTLAAFLSRCRAARSVKTPGGMAVPLS